MSNDLDHEKRGIRKGIVSKALLVGVFAVFMGTYLWMSYFYEGSLHPIQTKMLSYHDNLLSISRGTGDQIWAVGKNGVILNSKDEGRNWEQQVSGTDQSLLAISFDEKQRVGFAVGNGGIILATQDGGLSWKVRTPKQIEEFQGSIILFGVQVVSETKAYAVGAFGTFLSTSDGGESWTTHKFSWEKLMSGVRQEGSTTIEGQEPHLNSLYFISEKIGWVVGEFGLVLHTLDGGQTWTLQRGNVQLPQLSDVKFFNDRNGWATGQHGNLISTEDGGRNWLQCKVDTSKDLYGCAFEDRYIVVVGDHIILKSENRGSSWTQKQISETLVGVTLKGKSAIAVGEGGVIKRFESGGR